MKSNKKKVTKTPVKEVKKVSSKKVVTTSEKKPAAPVAKKPSVDASAELAKAKREIEAYKVTVGQLEAAVDQLRAKNLKAKKQIASLQEKLSKSSAVEPAKVSPAIDNRSTKFSVPGMFAVPPPAPVLIKEEIPSTPSVPGIQIPAVDHTAIPPVSSDFIKRCRAEMYS